MVGVALSGTLVPVIMPSCRLTARGSTAAPRPSSSTSCPHVIRDEVTAQDRLHLDTRRSGSVGASHQKLLAMLVNRE
ncbi:hypothetical protein [Ornithinimicrobium kibberense]|uniref:hypothetical protein n=1 Tax=Ornithinimicrobium kibberense TaxID=282060 RepID=UPI003621396B